MKKLNPQEELEQRIAFLKVKRDQDLMLLKYQYSETIDSLKPTNIIKTAIVDYVTAPNLKTQLLFGAIGLAKNYVSKNLINKFSNNPVVRFLGKYITF